MFDWFKNLFSKPEAQLEVTLDTSKVPPVIISNPDLKASGRKIRWVRGENQTFTFERLNDLNQRYFNKQSINLNQTRINCNNRAPDTGDADKYPYEIKVKQGNNVYSSTDPGAPPDDKPVIRN